MGKPGSEGAIGRHYGKVIAVAGGGQELDRELYGARISNHDQAGKSAKRARKLVKTLEQALVLMSEDDPMQPAVKDLYPILWQAEVRLNVLEDWYGRTYCSTDYKDAAKGWQLNGIPK